VQRKAKPDIAGKKDAALKVMAGIRSPVPV
jgi:hypothetical protein